MTNYAAYPEREQTRDEQHARNVQRRRHEAVTVRVLVLTGPNSERAVIVGRRTGASAVTAMTDPTSSEGRGTHRPEMWAFAPSIRQCGVS
jgi:hypothetical protein